MALTNVERNRRWRMRAVQSKRNFEGLEGDIEKIGDLLPELFFEAVLPKDDPEYYRDTIRLVRERLESWSVRQRNARAVLNRRAS